MQDLVSEDISTSTKIIYKINHFTVTSVVNFSLQIVAVADLEEVPRNPAFGFSCKRKFKANCQVQQVLVTNQNIKNNTYITL